MNKTWLLLNDAQVMQDPKQAHSWIGSSEIDSMKQLKDMGSDGMTLRGAKLSGTILVRQ